MFRSFRSASIFSSLTTVMLLWPSLTLASLNKQQVCSQSQLLENILQSQCEALIDLYNSTDGDNWRYNDGWGSNNVRNWSGVWVSLQDKKVQSLHLGYNHMRGELPSSFKQLMGADIHVNNNDLSGTLADDLFQSEKEARIYNFQHNNFSGAIPSSISNIKKSSQLNLSNNKFTGSVPSAIYEFASRAVSFNFSNNRLSGSLPHPPAVIDTGIFRPRLDLSGNNISGSIPSQLFRHYQHVYLQNNRLSGSIPDDISEFDGEAIFLSNNKLTGSLPEGFGKVSAEHVDLDNNQLSGAFPALDPSFSVRIRLNLSKNQFDGQVSKFLDEVGDIDHLNLSNNRLRGNLGNFKSRKISFLDISHNKISGGLASFEADWLHELNASHNNMTGTVGTIEANYLRSVDLSYNKLHGNIPLPVNYLYRNMRAWNLSHNVFDGEIPVDMQEMFNADIDISHNRLHGDVEAYKRRFEALNKNASINVTGQTPYLVDSRNETYVETLTTDNAKGVTFLISVPKSNRIKAVSGCEGRLRGNVFRVGSGQPACDFRVELEACQSFQDCLQDAGSTLGVKNARIESPAAGSVASGVVQFRGWLHEPDVRSHKHYSVNSARGAKLIIDDSDVNVEINFNRLDVSSAMGYNADNQTPVGWSALFYTGNLSNGPHTATLVSEEGLVVDTLTFESFTLQDESGKASYISDNSREVTIEDFPYLGSELTARFSPSEQSFSIVDQLNAQGVSTRSQAIHYSDDDLTPQNTGQINGVAQVNIETPNGDSDLLGVASLRGWAYGSQLLNGPLYMSLDDDEPFLLPRGERSDVEQAMGIRTSSKVGWSQLFYAGNLANGRHRLRLFGQQGNQKVLLAQSFFQSFVPLDENGAPVYINAGKTVHVKDFPFNGSQVSLKFDAAGQKFSVSKQEIN